MLEHQDELLNIAEISIGIAGFSGVIAAFLQRGGLGRFDRVRFVNLFVTAFSLLILSYVPIVVAELSTSVWFYSSLVMIGVGASHMIFGTLYILPVLNEDTGGSVMFPNTLIYVPSFAGGLVQFFNVMGWFWDSSFLAYLFGLFVYLYAACLFFLLLVLYRPKTQD